MKIWFITNDYKPSFGYGIGQYIEHASAMFTSAGHQITIFIGGETTQTLFETAQIRVIRFSPSNTNYPEYFDSYQQYGYDISAAVLKQIDLDGEAPNIIEAQDCMAVGYYLLKHKHQGDTRLQETPIIIQLHTPRFEFLKANNEAVFRYMFKEYVITEFEKAALLMADGIICPSHFLKEQLSQVLPQIAESITVIPLPYECEELELSPNYEHDFLCVGGLEKRKGIQRFLSIGLPIIEKNKRKLTLICRDYLNPYSQSSTKDTLTKDFAPYLQKEILNINDILPREVYFNILHKSNCIVIPSEYENFPYTCIEAMWQGCLVLASTQGGQAEIIEENSGFLFDWNNPDIPEKLQQIVSLPAAERLLIAQNAQKRIKTLCNYKKILTQRLSHLAKIHQQVVPKKESALELVSIIITTRKLSAHTVAVLNNVADSSYTKLEIIVIHLSAEQDKNNPLLNELSTISPHLKLIPVATNNINTARNIGFKNAHGQAVLFMYEFHEIAPTFIAQALKLLAQRDTVGCVYSWNVCQGQARPTYDIKKPLFFFKNITNKIGLYRRSALDKCPGYAESESETTAEYTLLLNLLAAGYSGEAIPQILTVSHLPVTPQQEWLEHIQTVFSLKPEQLHNHLQDMTMFFSMNHDIYT